MTPDFRLNTPAEAVSEATRQAALDPSEFIQPAGIKPCAGNTSRAGLKPFPDTVMLMALNELEATVVVPLFTPASNGKKLTVSEQLAFGSKVDPAQPVVVNPGGGVTAAIVAETTPTLVILTVRDIVVPIATAPNATEVVEEQRSASGSDYSRICIDDTRTADRRCTS